MTHSNRVSSPVLPLPLPFAVAVSPAMTDGGGRNDSSISLESQATDDFCFCRCCRVADVVDTAVGVGAGIISALIDSKREAQNNECCSASMTRSSGCCECPLFFFSPFSDVLFVEDKNDDDNVARSTKPVEGFSISNNRVRRGTLSGSKSRSIFPKVGSAMANGSAFVLYNSTPLPLSSAAGSEEAESPPEPEADCCSLFDFSSTSM
mmetsp:Transcript_20171/g.42380  ORF Transcript_20171/g.42380 Transcript_20171/m.42380 type:complete len:207 (-) Transcript_20171:579-1199(-)